MAETTAVCETIPGVMAAGWFKAANSEILSADAAEQSTAMSGAPIFDNKIMIWAPALAKEPKKMILAWAKAASKLITGVQVVVILNGFGSEQACQELRRDVPPEVQVYALPGLASIGRAQQAIMHQFLQSDAQTLARIDPDGQFPMSSFAELSSRLVPGGPDVMVGQRDEASVSGRSRFFGNLVLRLAAMRLGLVADPNSGLYAMNRGAAAALCQLPLPRYPEPRMLAWLRSESLHVSSLVVPTLPRQSGTSSIKGIWRGAAVFVSSLLELLSCDRL